MNSSMVKCEQCGAICNIKDGYCKKCWKKLPIEGKQHNEFIVDGIGLTELENFIEKNSDRYIEIFKKNSGKKFFLNINWAALFFSVNWLLYRKMYKFAIVSFSILCLTILIIATICYIPHIEELTKLNDAVTAKNVYLDRGDETVLLDSKGIMYTPNVVQEGKLAEDRINEIDFNVTVKSFLIVPFFCLFWGLFGDAFYKKHVFKNFRNKDGGTSILSLAFGRIALNIIETLIFSFLLPFIVLLLSV